MTIDEQLAVCNAATPGPWTNELDSTPPDNGIDVDGGGFYVCHIQEHGSINTAARHNGEQFSHADARFIPVARTHYPAALRAMADIRRLALDAGYYSIASLVDQFERGEYGAE